MKTTITRKYEWDMGHRIPDHLSLCKNPHGHRYVVELTVEGPVIEEQSSPERGMVKDFGFLKKMLYFIERDWDHSFMVFKEDPFAAALALFDRQQREPAFQQDPEPLRIVMVDFIPTAENIAAFIFRKLTNNNQGFKVTSVTVWETPNCKATVTE